MDRCKRSAFVRTRALSRHIRSHYNTGDGQLAPDKLTQALAHGALYHGADVFEYCDVHSLIMENETVKGVQTSKGSFYGEKVVIAAGSWAKRFISSEHLGEVFPVKGECIALQSHKPLLSKTIF